MSVFYNSLLLYKDILSVRRITICDKQVSMGEGAGIREELNALFQKEVTKPLHIERTKFIWDDYLEAHMVYGHAGFIIAMLKRTGLLHSTFDDMLKEQIHFKDENPLKQAVGQTG